MRRCPGSAIRSATSSAWPRTSTPKRRRAPSAAASAAPWPAERAREDRPPQARERESTSMKRSVLPVILALALLAGLAVFFFGGGASRGQEDRAAARPAAAAELREARKSADLAAAGAAPEEHALAEDAAASDRGARVADASAAAAPERSFLVRIVTGADKPPVPGAQVLACVSAGEVDEAFRDPQEVDAWMQEHGVHLAAADEHGLVSVPAGTSEGAKTLVLARPEGLFGTGIFTAPAPGAEGEATPQLALALDVEIAALAVDERGRPVEGLGVSLERWHPGNGHYAVRSLT